MRALSIRQPWAWLILNAGKDIENRDWLTHYRGPILIHAGKAMTRADYQEGLTTLASIQRNRGGDIILPDYYELERGGIVGQVEITDCVTVSHSPWFFGFFGFTLENPKPLPFRAYPGQLGFFEVPTELEIG